MEASHFHRIFFVQIAQLRHVLVAEQRVVVEIDLGIEADDVAVFRHHQRIDFEQAHVLGEERVVEALHDLAALLGGVAFELQRGRDVEADIRRITHRRFDLEGLDLLRRLVRHFLDVHAAFGGGDEGDARCRAIHQRGQIKFAVDGRAVFDIKPLHQAAMRARLMRHQRHAQHALGFAASHPRWI